MTEFKLELVPEDIEVKQSHQTRYGDLRRPWNIQRLRLEWGPGPEGERCGTCRFKLSTGLRNTRRYFKCELTKNTWGPATDIRLKWPACAKWEAKDDEPGV